MAWVGIADSGLEFIFTPAGGTTMVGSLATAVDAVDPTFEIQLITEPVETPVFRVTVQSYAAGNPAGPVANAVFYLSSENPQVIVTNQAAPANPQVAFTPAQFQGDCRALTYNGSVGNEWSGIETFSFLIEVEEVEGADPPSLERIDPILQNYQAFEASDRTFTGWIRGREGRSDLTGLTLGVLAYPYGGRRIQPIMIEATSPEPTLGRIDFAIPASLTLTRLRPGLYRLQFMVSDGATTQTAHGGILEVV